MFYSGSSGGIKFGKAGVVDGKANNEEGTGWKALDTRVTNWTLNVTAQLLDTTTLGDYDKSSVYGLRTTTGSVASSITPTPIRPTTPLPRTTQPTGSSVP